MVYARRSAVANLRPRLLLAACIAAGCSAPNPRFGLDQDGGADGTQDGRTPPGDDGSADGQRGTADGTGSMGSTGGPSGVDVGAETTTGPFDTADDAPQTSDTGQHMATAGPGLTCDLGGEGLIQIDANFAQMQGDLCSNPLLLNVGAINFTATGFEHVSGCGGCPCLMGNVVSVDLQDTLALPLLPPCGDVLLWGEDNGQGCETTGFAVRDQAGNPIFLGANTRSVPTNFLAGFEATFGTAIERCDGQCNDTEVGRHMLQTGDVEIGPGDVDIPASLDFGTNLPAWVTYHEAMVLDGCKEMVSWTATF